MDAANAQRPGTGTPALFAAERTLGRLAKWLRLMGFDTLSEIDYPRGSFLPRIGPQRVFLTRTQRLRAAAVGLGTIFIQANDPRQQAVEVIRKAAIRREDLRPFSRCVRCNAGIVAVARTAVWRSVPDYVWSTGVNFSACPQCGRVYWKGSHAERALKELDAVLTAAEGA